MDDPRPMRGLPQALAVAGTDGRVLVADTHEAIGLLGDLLLKSGARVVGHETKPLVVANIAGGADAAASRRLRHSNRRVSPERLAPKPDHRRRRP